MSIRLLASLPLVFAVACQSEVDNKPAADMAPATPPVAAPPAAAPAAPDGDAALAANVDVTPYAFDNTTSTLGFVAAKVTKDHTGGFGAFRGTAKMAGDKLSAVEVEVDLASVTTDAPKLTGHLQSPDFFDVGQFAKATFKSSSVTAGDAGAYTVTGTLDLHGIQKELSFPVTVAATDGGQKATGEFTINRQDWGITYPGKPDDLIKDAVLIKVDIALTPLAG